MLKGVVIGGEFYMGLMETNCKQMKKEAKSTVQVIPVCPVERKNILDSLIASFRIEGIFISEARAQTIYARVNEKLKK